MPGKPGSFAAYLEYTQRNQAAPALSRIAAFQTPSPSIKAPGDLLGVLSRQPEGSISLGQLANLCALSAAAFHQMLKASSDASLIEVQGPPLQETVSLTSKGRELAALA